MASGTVEDEIIIPVEPEAAEIDSAYGDDAASSTASITSSIRDFRQIHGRTYQNYKALDYWGPNDEIQAEQLDIIHHLLTLLLDGKLFLAPLPSTPQKVLDVGTGTGIWAIDFADQYPSAEVLGIDLSDIMPTFVPPNCKFEIDDVERDWTFAPNTFDFVYLRYMMGAISDWPRLYSQAFKAIKPGGYIEHFDMSVVFECDDGTLTKENPLYKWGPLQIAASEKMGKTLAIYDKTKQNIINAGFVDVVEHKFKLPVGPWSSNPKMKQIGLWNMMFFMRDIEGFTLYLLCTFMGWSHTEVVAWVGEVTAALKDSKVHTYYKANIIYGRKPEAV